MNLIKTKSFVLASYFKGNENAPKLALVLPGRMDTKDYPHLKSHAEYLARRGYLAISFDPPGTWESPGSIDLYTMTNYLKAINELIEHFGNRPTLALGHSRGGSMAILAGTRNKLVTHFVSIMGNYSYAASTYKSYPDKDWQAKGFRIEKRDLPDSPKKTKVFHLPYAFLEDGTKYDMLDDLKKCPKPKLFIFGTKDTIAPPELMQKAYEESAPPKELFSLETDDHDYRLHPSLIDIVNETVGKFLDKYTT